MFDSRVGDRLRRHGDVVPLAAGRSARAAAARDRQRRARAGERRRAAFAGVRPFGVDVRSGVERDGVKDRTMMRAFVRAVRESDEGKRLQKPDSRGYFGKFGGMFVPEVLVGAVTELEHAMNDAFADPSFWARVSRRAARLRRTSVAGLSRRTAARDRTPRRWCSSAKTSTTPARTRSTTRSVRRCSRGAWARRASSPRPAPVSTAWRPRPSVRSSACRSKCSWVRVDVERQALNVYVMKLLGATVHSVDSGNAHAQGRDERSVPRLGRPRCDDTFYIIGSVVGAHPYPYMVREFQKVIGIEARAQVLERYGRLPSDVVACVGGGSNAMGIFAGFVDDAAVKLWGVEAVGSRPRPRSTRRPRINAGQRRHPARLAFVCAADAGGPGARHALDQRRTRLSGRRTRACVSQRFAAARPTSSVDG